MRNLSTILVSILISFLLVGTVIAQWVQINGPSGGVASCFVLSPDGEDFADVFATVNGSVYLSTDAVGAHWARTALANTNVWHLAFSAYGGGRNLFAGTDGDGVFLSTDNGSTWTARNSGLLSLKVLTLAVSDSGEDPILFAGTPLGVFRSTDNGSSWTSDSTSPKWVNTIHFNGGHVFASNGGWGMYRSVDSGATWEFMGTGTNQTLQSVVFTGVNAGIAVGAGGDILRTTDGGVTWLRQTSGVLSTLNGVSYGDANNATAVGDSGLILHSNDGGAHWSVQSGGTAQFLRDVRFTDANTGTAVGDSGYILRTTDGGSSWTKQNSGSTANLTGVSFIDSTHGVIVGAYTLLQTTDGGSSWMSQQLPSYPWLNDVTMIDINIWFVVGAFGQIIRTTDGGSTWTNQSSGTTYGLNDIFFIDANNGITVGHGYAMLHTTDGGTTWMDVHESWKDLYGVYFADATTGTAVGWGGTILRTTDGGASWKDYNDAIAREQITALASITEGDSTFLIAGTITGFLFISPDEGMHWTALNAGRFYSPRFLYSLPDGTGGETIIMGNNIGLYISTDAGSLWTSMAGASNGLTNRDVLSFAAVPDGSGGAIFMAGTNGGGIYRSTDNGANWEWVSEGLPSISVYDLVAGHLSDGSVGVLFARTARGGIFRSLDHGDTWIPVNSGLTEGVQVLLAVPNDTGVQDLFAGIGYELFLSTNNGDAWIRIDSGFSNPIRSINVVRSHSGGRIIYVSTGHCGRGGCDGNIYRSFDDGSTWANLSGWYVPELAVVSTGDSNRVFIGTSCGDGCVLIRSTDEGSHWIANNQAPWDFTDFAAGADSFIFIASGPKIYRSRDYGASWIEADSGLTSSEIRCLYSLGSILFAGSATGEVFMSRNNGEYWTMVGSLFTGIQSITVIDSILFAATEGCLIYRHPLAGLINAVQPPSRALPVEFALGQNYPNPFNPTTTIRYQLPIRSHVTLTVFDLLGREVATLVNDVEEPGYKSVDWDATRFTSGIYFYRLQAGSFIETNKLILLK